MADLSKMSPEEKDRLIQKQSSDLEKQNGVISHLNSKLADAEKKLEGTGAFPTVSVKGNSKVKGGTYEVRLKGKTIYKTKVLTAKDIAADADLAAHLIEKGAAYMVKTED